MAENAGGAGGATGTPEEQAAALQAQLDAAVTKAVAGLKAKNTELMGKLKAADDRLAVLGEMETDDVKKALQLAADVRDKRARAEGDFETLKKQMVDQHNTDLAKATTRSQRVESKLFDVMARREAESAITAAGGNARVLLPHLIQHIRVSEQGADFVAQVVDAAGAPRIADAQGTPMTIAQLVETFKKDETFGIAFAASGAGSGARGGGAAGAGGKAAVTLTAEQARDTMVYRRAKEEAEKAGVPLVIGS